MHKLLCPFLAHGRPCPFFPWTGYSGIHISSNHPLCLIQHLLPLPPPLPSSWHQFTPLLLPLTLTRPGLVLVTPLPRWHEHMFLWLVTMAEAKHYFILHIYQGFSQLWQPWSHHHEPFLLLESLHRELINSMMDIHHPLRFPDDWPKPLPGGPKSSPVSCGLTQIVPQEATFTGWKARCGAEPMPDLCVVRPCVSRGWNTFKHYPASMCRV